MGLLHLLTKNQKIKDKASSQISTEFHSLFEDHPDAVCIFDIKGNVISVNEQLTLLLGYSTKDLEFLQQVFLHKNNLEQVRYYFHMATEGKSESFDISVRQKRGKVVPLNITFIPSCKDGETEFVFAVCKDMSEVKNIQKKVYHLNSQLEETQRATNIGNWELDVVTGKVNWTLQSYEIFGTRDTDFQPTYENVFVFIHPKDRDKFTNKFNQMIIKKQGMEFDYRIIRKDGQVLTLYLRGDVILDNDGEVVRALGTIQDITEQKAIELKLTQSENLFQSVTNHLPVAIWSYDVLKKKMTFCSQGVKDIYGVSPEMFQADSRLWLKFVYVEDRKAVEQNHGNLVMGEEQSQSYRIKDANGNMKWVHTDIIPYFDEDGTHIRTDGIVKDITDKKNHIESLAFMADHDYLTKLPNRRYFERNLQDLIESSRKNQQKFAVCYLDLDRFKYINDTLGHEIGDEFLIKFAKRLRKFLGSDTFFARIGGDEFAVCLHDSNGIENAIDLAKKLIKEVEKPFYIEDYELFVTTSIGISMFPIDGEDSRTLLRNADTALYKAKESGRNDWQVFSASMNVQSFKLYQLEKDLRKSLMNGELYVEYQPKVNPKTSKIVGAEALVRWKHPEWGVVSPGEFIPLAEENGFIFKMGDWVLNEVCQMIGKWERQGLPVVPISVNVSPKRLLKTDFVKTVRESITSAAIDPSLIELELTEQTVIKNTEATKNIIAELRSIGVKIALDDFGTGYSSLSYLKDLDIDTLKIDKSFIDGITQKSANDAIVKSLIFLSKEVDINIVAEGVETKEQLTFLLQQECQQIQGYIYSRPVGEAKFKSLLKKEVLKPLQTKSAAEPTENRRKYFRIKFDCPLTANMTIVKFRGKDVTLGTSRAVIEDISLGGLKYTSNINLPIQKDMVIQFSTIIMGTEVQLMGSNVWKLEVDGLFQYGFEFAFNEADRDKLAPILNKIILQFKQCSILPDSNILQENKLCYLNG